VLKVLPEQPVRKVILARRVPKVLPELPVQKVILARRVPKVPPERKVIPVRRALLAQLAQ
jgi:hypothetical protein